MALLSNHSEGQTQGQHCVRPSWDQTWMAVADAVALRSRCDGRKIGSVVVSADNAYSCVGYNGPPAGWVTPTEGDCQEWCPRTLNRVPGTSYDNCYTAHAEANALLRADHSRVQGGTLYVTSACCWECGKLVANSGVSRVVMRVEDADAHRRPLRTILFIESCGVEVLRWTG